MTSKSHKTKICCISQRSYDVSDLVEGKNIRPKLFALIKEEHPDFDEKSFINIGELTKYRKKYLETILRDELGELSKIEHEVISSISEGEILSANIEPDIENKISFGDALADRVAEFGGSWAFIISFFAFCFIWMLINLFSLFQKPFDPYPFILLNLVLSCLAAIQAPIILMSQNRKEEKDRKRSEHDYKINLKAELEIRLLHEKIDYLMVQQNQRFIEIQQIQMDLMEDILAKIK